VSNSLAETQKRLWRLIAWPEGIRLALLEEARRESGIAPLDKLVTSDERLGAEDRLDVYANAYFYRIHDVLADDYPTLAQALGETGFHDLVTSYLAVHPSEHPSLRWIGERLPGFLASHPASESTRTSCPFGADLAAYEWAFQMVFDAADTPTMRREDLASLPAERWDALEVRLRPSVRTLDLAWPVHELRSAAGTEGIERTEGNLPEIKSRASSLCVWRHNERVSHRTLDESEARALQQACRGVAFGALCEEISREAAEGEAPARAAAWLARWIDDELILATG
jgi:hypothetical protein